MSEKFDEVLIHEYVGDLSQELEECSYNEFSIRHYLNNPDTLISHFEWIEKDRHWSTDRLKERYGIKNAQECYDLLLALVKKFNGWPVNWSSEPEDLDPLTEKERDLISK